MHSGDPGEEGWKEKDSWGRWGPDLRRSVQFGCCSPTTCCRPVLDAAPTWCCHVFPELYPPQYLRYPVSQGQGQWASTTCMNVVGSLGLSAGRRNLGRGKMRSSLHPAPGTGNTVRPVYVTAPHSSQSQARVRCHSNPV